MEERILHGSCLCGGVRFEIVGRVSAIGQCHCSKCRKASGTGSIADLMTSKKSLRYVAGEELVRSFSQPSGYTRAFCDRCGSRLPQMHRNGKVYWVPAGLLDDEPAVDVAMHIYVGSKAAWDRLPEGGVQHEEDWPDRPE